MTWRDLWEPEGAVGRGPYAVLGAVLFALKHNLDRLIASAVFGRPWSPFNYFAPGGLLTSLSGPDARFYAALLVTALPFIWVGVALTLRRLRSAGLPAWLVVLFFVPFANLLFFLVLCLLPSRSPAAATGPAFLDRLVPRSQSGSAALGVLLASLVCLALVNLGVTIFRQYGWGVFVGLPFAMGFISALIYGYHAPRSLGGCIAVGFLSVTIAGAALIAVAVEGVFCLLMAAPLALILAAMGALLGYCIQSDPHRGRASAPHLLLALLLACPSLMWAEYAAAPLPPLIPVRTSVEIDAPPDLVWRHVVAFAALPDPDEWFFRLGIAYPTRAQIDGRGPGAVRHCIFSTGEFVEPIQVWDEPRLLRFSVVSQPAPLREWTLYPEIHPPHLDSYLSSKQGQFLLTALPGGRTRLEGTTWYENRMWPADYWRPWSDWIIHRIHRRVLEHIARLTCGVGTLACQPA